MKVLAIPEALESGRAERVPPRKPALAYPRAFHPEAIPARITNPAEGRAPHAREEDLTSSPCIPIQPPASRLATGANESPCYP